MIHHRLRGLQKGGGAVNVADVFATSLYTGNGSTQTITNGIDLAGQGGLVWIKLYSAGADHVLFDTERGVFKYLYSVNTLAQAQNVNSLTDFLSTGFSIGSFNLVSLNTFSFASWTFRQAARFFDVVTYTGDGVAGREIAHGLGIAPGMIFIKKTNAAKNWGVYHRSQSSGYGYLNTTDAFTTAAAAELFGNDLATISPSNTVFTLGSNDVVNGNTQTYVAYLFAHDPDGVIQCGSYTGNGSAIGPEITLGWEPQYLLIKNASASANWVVYDSARDTSNPRTYKLFPNLADAEDTAGEDIDFTSTGFQPKSTDATINANTNTYIYMAIKKAS